MDRGTPLGPDATTLRLTIERLEIGTLDDSWLSRMVLEIESLLKEVRILDKIDLRQEEPATIFTNKGA